MFEFICFDFTYRNCELYAFVLIYDAWGLLSILEGKCNPLDVGLVDRAIGLVARFGDRYIL